MMNETPPKPKPVRSKTQRKESFWQITFPLILGVALILGMAAWTMATAIQGGNVSQSADTSLTFLLIPAMAMALIPLALFAGLAYAVIWLNQNITPYLRQAQEAMVMVRDGVRAGADKLVAPVIRFKSRMAALEVLKPKR
jgi:hypothetical protein